VVVRAREANASTFLARPLSPSTWLRRLRHRGVLTLISGASPATRETLRRAGVDELVTYADDRTT